MIWYPYIPLFSWVNPWCLLSHVCWLLSDKRLSAVEFPQDQMQAFLSCGGWVNNRLPLEPQNQMVTCIKSLCWGLMARDRDIAALKSMKISHMFPRLSASRNSCPTIHHICRSRTKFSSFHQIRESAATAILRWATELVYWVVSVLSMLAL